MNLQDILKIEPYSLNKTEKEKIFGPFISALSAHHYENCRSYKKIADGFGYDVKKERTLSETLFLPVQLFKTTKLISSTKSDLKILLSSGTSGENKAQIYLDNENSANQTKVLAKIVSSFIGKKRLPMAIIDSSNVMDDRTQLPARAAGIIGFSIFGSAPVYMLDKEMELDINLFENFIKQHKGKTVLLFGLTYIIYEYFYKALLKYKERPNLSNAILIHGGGWKKLEEESVSDEDFRYKLNKVCGIKHVYNYYGMAEQTGSIYMQCEAGYFHASEFSDIFIRRALDFSIADLGEEGIIQVLSLLPKSYPGHSLLTEDKGILLGEDNCSCNRKGKYFKVTGRVKHSEPRGCGDRYE